MEQIKFYCQNIPKAGETVQVVFTDRKEDHTEGYLTEYDGNIIMVHSQATKKKKIKSFNKVIPLNKPLAAVIEDFDKDRKLGSVSRAYLDLPEEEFSRKFGNNNRIFYGINQICINLNLDFVETWKDRIFPYLQEYTLEKFIENPEIPDEILKNKELKDMIKDKFSNLTVKKEVFKTEVGIISNDGIEKTKRIIEKSLHEIEDSEHFCIKYKNSPNYSVETSISDEALKEFIELIKKNSKEEKNVFVKVY